MKTLVAIPVFNEAKYLPDVLKQVRRRADHVLVVDDGSTDATQDILARQSGIHVIRHPENRGYGQSLIDAFAFASAEGFDWVITIDCDEQHEPERIPDFLVRIEQDDADIISGSRYLMTMPGSTDAPDDRRRINQTITRLLNDRLGLTLTDSFCGFKAHRVSAMDRLCLTVPGYAFPLQFWVQAWRAGLRISEMAVALIYNDPTRHFGGRLDDPESRLTHYLEVFEREMARTRKSCGWDAVKCCGAST